MTTTLTLPFGAPNSARFSPCGAYRYTLTREDLGGSGTVVSIGLNPSTATAETNDPTITREMGFCRAWGMARLVKVNLFALRSTDPRGLLEVVDPVGPENDAAIVDAARGATTVLCAWGSHAFLRRILPARVAHVVAMLRGLGATTWCLGVAKDGAPRHPLYLPRGTALERWG